jgi:hypothetical protein
MRIVTKTVNYCFLIEKALIKVEFSSPIVIDTFLLHRRKKTTI